jgi:hypothetical protein
MSSAGCTHKARSRAEFNDPLLWRRTNGEGNTRQSIPGDYHD